ncbi:MAG TPA: OmpA family protein [Hyphomonadaceae bacterium]|nr:OmpA family protein [Hyphomonadaceae bacterium]HPN06195.1 OmpA family protein [Hyphomonadaceae bacterium]
MKRTLAFMGAALALGACATDPVTGQSIYGNTGRGAAIGAIVGGVGGLFAGGKDGRNVAVGAAVGALAGAGVGRYMDGQEEDMRRKVASSGIGLQRQGDNVVLVMPSDVTFAKGSATLDAQFTPVLNKVAESLNLYPKTTIDIVGHASTEGEAQANLDLSYRRAESVRMYLQGAGVIPQRMASGGLGESQPLIVPDDTEAKRSQNRRVVITLRPVVE